MKTFQNVLVLLVAVSLAGTISCAKNAVNGCGANFVLGFQLVDEVTAVSVASEQYSQDPTPANCQKYRAAYLDYLNELERFEKCARDSGQQEDYQQSLDEAREEIDQLQC